MSGAKGLSGGDIEIDSQKTLWGESPKKGGNPMVARIGGEGEEERRDQRCLGVEPELRKAVRPPEGMYILGPTLNCAKIRPLGGRGRI